MEAHLQLASGKTPLAGSLPEASARPGAQSATSPTSAPSDAYLPLRPILDSAGEAFVSIDSDGRVLMWNRAAEATFGWSEAEAAGRRLSELIIPERHREAHERGVRRFLATGEGKLVDRRLEIEGLHRDGHEVPVELTLASMEVEGRTVFNAFLHDIAERREAEAATRFLAGIVESSDDAIVARDLDGTVRAWNAGAERVLGYEAAQMIGRSIAPVWREDRARFDEMQRSLKAGERMPTFEARAVRGDGKVIDVSVTASPLKDPEGRITGVSVIFRDISAHRAAEAESRLLAALVAGSEDAIVASALDGTITSWNPGAERLYGYTAEEMTGESIALVLPEGHPHPPEVQAALAAGERIPAFERQDVLKHGTLLDVSVSLSPVKDGASRVIGVASIVRDVSARKRAERDFHQALRRFETAFEAAPTGMALVACDGHWLAVNDSLCRLLGRSEAELLKTTFQSISHADDLEPNLDRVRQALAGEIDGYEMEKRYLRPDGSLVWTMLHVSLVRDDDGEPLHFIFQLQDVTDRKQTEQELRAYSEHLNELALQDPVTGLPNYRDFHCMLDTELERARWHGGRWSVVLFDVDAFREINAVGGRLEGDRVLAAVGGAIEQARRSSDRAARIGSDEFALILPESTPQDAARTARRISAEVAAQTDGVSLAHGTGSWPDDGESVQLVLLRADMQLQAAKPRGDGSRALEEPPQERRPAVPAGTARILALAREQLGMDVAYIAEISEDTQVLRSVGGDASSFGMSEGSKLPRAETYCTRMLDGRIANAVPDAHADPEVRDLGLTEQAEVGSYIGVPLELPDGSVYGTLCCVSHSPTPGLAERHVELLAFLAEVIVDQIDRHEQEASSQRSQIELAGINALLSALVARDHYTGEHSKTVVRQAVEVARRLGLGREQMLEVEHVALLHDIGKVGVPDSVLQKRGMLSDQEWELMRQHPAIGARILEATETLSHLAGAVKAEHERFDGSGYPDGLRGEEIPLASRITFACDAYHAMTSDRPYRAALPVERARAELLANAGLQFDPRVVQALLAVVEMEQAEPPAPRPPQLTIATGGLATSVLDSELPRQTPAWKPREGGPAANAFGEVRAICRRCGSHVPAVVTRASMSGNCGNCGSYELDLRSS